jgi:4-hydroxy-tetrahydrodipicolinate synthase
MTASLRLRGVYVPLVTPFGPDGKVALDSVERLAHECLDAGAAGLVALGTTGEPATLDAAEKEAVIDTCAAVCRERGAALIVGAGSNSTADSVRALRALGQRPAVVASLSVVPYYTRPSEQGILEHFRTLAAESPVPVIVYNIPYRTGRAVSAEGLLALAATPNIAGVKHAVGGIDQDTLDLLAAAPDGFAVLCGDDAYLAAAHICTERFVRMVEAVLSGDLAAGRTLARRLQPLVTALFAEPNPAVTKGVLHAQGRIPSPSLRAPMTPASPTAVDRALATIDQIGP